MDVCKRLGIGGEKSTRYAVKNILGPLSYVDADTRFCEINPLSTNGDWPAFQDFKISGPNVNKFWAMFYPEEYAGKQYARNVGFEERTKQLVGRRY